MPGGDRTGPRGEGLMTGWGRGVCCGGARWGGGCGRGGRGSGWRHGWGGRGAGRPYWDDGPGYGFVQSREAELPLLRDQVTHTEGVLDELRRRIADLEQAQDSDE
jgi:hypothetical protein